MARNDPRDRESGSTTFEALVAVLILAVVGAAALGAATGGIRAYALGRRASLAAARALAADDALRGAVREILVPWWDFQTRPETGAGALRMACWRGLADQALSVSNTDAGLALAAPGVSRLLPGVRLVSAQALPDSGAPPRGLRVEYEIDGRFFVTQAEFGSRALSEDSP